VPHYALGIDTGGTFTDGVIFDLDSREVVAKTKVITDRFDLADTIDGCLDTLFSRPEVRLSGRDSLPDIVMSCLSTTLATNATVEGQGADVGLILIGIDIDKNLPTTHSISVAGGYDINGKEKRPVDLDAVAEAVKRMESEVEAFAVSGYMSVRNPEQELEVSRIIRETTGYPVVCGHHLSGDLGVYERSVTAVLNARLIPLISRLIDAAKQSLTGRGITAPLRIVKGDGSLIDEAVAREKPIETILSGPAASLIGARVLSGIHEGIVVDIGGTTTDVAVLKRGKPILRDEGASVGGWLTRVKAAEITTLGLGGDSLIGVSRSGILSVGPQKVFPLCWAVSEHPHLLDELEKVRETRFSPLEAQPTCVLFFVREPGGAVLREAERKLLDLIRNEPHSLLAAGELLGMDPSLIPWKRLVTIGAIHRANLTPTDILHVRGGFTRWDTAAAEEGVEILARRYRKPPEHFMEDVLETIRYTLFSLLVEKCVKLKNRNVDLREDTGSDYLLRRMFADAAGTSGDISFSARMDMPVVGVGAPVKAYLPEVVARLSSRFLSHDHSDVANAVGTVNGMVVERVRVLIKPGETGGVFVYGPEKRSIFSELSEAVEYAETTARETARDRCEAAGGTDIAVEVDRNDTYAALTPDMLLPDDTAAGGDLFVETSFEAQAIGRPW
jgi:N-methylhydantoinase A/oxoprolinase/acetone carboxylase beta subunit